MTQRKTGSHDDGLTTIWDERYCTDAASTNSTTKQAEVVRAAMGEGLLRLQPWPWNEARAWESIGQVHEASYVEAVRFGQPRHLAESQGFRWSPGFAKAVARIWAGHAFACRLALREGLVFHPVSGAHHADAARGGGFCTFNFLVGAGRQLLETGAVRRVAIVDLDAHQGDGTWRLVRDDRRFGVFDAAGSDWIGEQGRGVDERACFHVVPDADAYAKAMATLPAFLDAFRPDLVQFQAGMDCHEDDPVGGIRGVDAGFLAQRDRLVIDEVLARGIPLVINLAGGYQSDGTSVALHVQTARIARARVRAARRSKTGRRSHTLSDR